jgi:hypothetical protein
LSRVGGRRAGATAARTRRTRQSYAELGGLDSVDVRRNFGALRAVLHRDEVRHGDGRQDADDGDDDHELDERERLLVGLEHLVWFSSVVPDFAAGRLVSVAP